MLTQAFKHSTVGGCPHLQLEASEGHQVVPHDFAPDSALPRHRGEAQQQQNADSVPSNNAEGPRLEGDLRSTKAAILDG